MGFVITLFGLSLVLSIAAIIISMRAWSGLELSREALTRSLEAVIAVQALKQSTHTAIPVGNEDAVKMFEEKIRNIVGPGQKDLQDNLEKNGFPIDDDVEELV